MKRAIKSILTLTVPLAVESKKGNGKGRGKGRSGGMSIHFNLDDLERELRELERFMLSNGFEEDVRKHLNQGGKKPSNGGKGGQGGKKEHDYWHEDQDFNKWQEESEWDEFDTDGEEWDEWDDWEWQEYHAQTNAEIEQHWAEIEAWINSEDGWDYHQTKLQFDRFFHDKDPSSMSQQTLAEFEREFEHAIKQIHKGKHSGKIHEDHQSPYIVEGTQQSKFENRQYEQLYSVALYSASERTRQLRRQGNDTEEGWLEDWQEIALAIVASVIITSIVCLSIFCFIRKSRKSRTFMDPSSESELESRSRRRRGQSAIENDVQVSDYSVSDGPSRARSSQRSLHQSERRSLANEIRTNPQDRQRRPSHRSHQQQPDPQDRPRRESVRRANPQDRPGRENQDYAPQVVAPSPGKGRHPLKAVDDVSYL